MMRGFQSVEEDKRFFKGRKLVRTCAGGEETDSSVAFELEAEAVGATQCSTLAALAAGTAADISRCSEDAPLRAFGSAA